MFIWAPPYLPRDPYLVLLVAKTAHPALHEIVILQLTYHFRYLPLHSIQFLVYNIATSHFFQCPRQLLRHTWRHFRRIVSKTLGNSLFNIIDLPAARSFACAEVCLYTVVSFGFTKTTPDRVLNNGFAKLISD